MHVIMELVLKAGELLGCQPSLGCIVGYSVRFFIRITSESITRSHQFVFKMFRVSIDVSPEKIYEWAVSTEKMLKPLIT